MNEYVLLLFPPGRVEPALACPAAPCCGLSPEPDGTAVFLDGDWSGCTGGDGRPVTEASEPLAALAAYRGESGELVIWAPAPSLGCLPPESQTAIGFAYGSERPAEPIDAPLLSR